MNINKSVIFGIPFLIGGIAAIISPNNIMDFIFARNLYDVASFLFPGLGKMKGDYELGDVAKFYYSLFWIMSPLLIFGSYANLQKQRDKIIENCKEKKLFFILFFCVFSLVCAFALVNFNFESKDVDDVRIYLSFHSRWGMMLFGWIVPASASALFAMAIFGFINIIDIFE